MSARALVLLLPCAAFAQAEAVQRVVITGAIVERAVADAPYAIGVVDADALRTSGPLINLSESMARVPGLVVNNRHNFAQDLQISARGFGARTAFGVRGLRLYSDGIPATMPDGQGQVAHFDLADAQRIEVLRGPFSALYGNSSGGVIAVFSAPVERQRVEAALDAGSFGLRQARASFATPLGEGWLRGGGAAMHVGGFRPHSAAERRLATLRAGWQRDSDQLTLQLSAFDQPAQDPLGLTRAQFDADPDQTTPQARQFDTRKTARQHQLGARWRHRFGDAGPLREASLMAYAGQRSVTQWQAIAPATQANPGHGGGVVDFDRDYGGSEARLVWRAGPAEIVTGVGLETVRDARRGFENFIGPQLGVTGALRRDETNTATSRDGFAQAEWELSPNVAATLGVRSGELRLRTRDHYLGNGDDSGALRYAYTNPVAGLRWRATPHLNLYASAARGVESPTLGELAYRADGLGGFNDTLRAQRSRQFEAGAKWRGGGLEIDAALFWAAVDDEIGIVSNAGGRSSFTNVGRTLRRGAELAAAWHIAPRWRAQLALSTLDAFYRDGFLTCAGVPCLAPSVPVAAGNRIAGTQRASAFAELAWRDEWAFEARHAGRTAVNDINSDFAPRYTTLALRWQRAWTLQDGLKLELLARLENLTNRRYAGSVIVNEANGRFFESAPGRHAMLGVRLVYASNELVR
jgi:iron complex outermembrane receptor protein